MYGYPSLLWNFDLLFFYRIPAKILSSLLLGHAITQSLHVQHGIECTNIVIYYIKRNKMSNIFISECQSHHICYKRSRKKRNIFICLFSCLFIFRVFSYFALSPFNECNLSSLFFSIHFETVRCGSLFLAFVL